MIFNCLNCGISISTKKENCIYCKANNAEIIEVLSEKSKFPKVKEKFDVREKIKGTILAFVLR